MACVSYYRERGHAVTALFVDYGQRARSMELKAARVISRRLGVPLKIVRLTAPDVPLDSSRGRNALLLVVALAAFDWNAGMIALGIHAGTAYPDCSPAFVKHVQRLYDTYGFGRVRLDAPFVAWTKRDVYDFALQQDLPLQFTYSCLRGRSRPCGACESCKDVEALRVS